MRHTARHTYAILKVSKALYDEIRQKLAEAGYQDQFYENGVGLECIDMTGIAITPRKDDE